MIREANHLQKKNPELRIEDLFTFLAGSKSLDETITFRKLSDQETWEFKVLQSSQLSLATCGTVINYTDRAQCKQQQDTLHAINQPTLQQIQQTYQSCAVPPKHRSSLHLRDQEIIRPHALPCSSQMTDRNAGMSKSCLLSFICLMAHAKAYVCLLAVLTFSQIQVAQQPPGASSSHCSRSVSKSRTAWRTQIRGADSPL